MNYFQPDIMIDVEALGSVVTQIGAVKFNIRTDVRDKGVSWNLNIPEQIDKGLSIDWTNVKFWLEETAKTGNNPSWIKNSVSVDKTIYELSCYCGGRGSFERVWCHNYDYQILRDLGKVFKHKMPWSHKKWNDYGSLIKWSGFKATKEMREQKTHNALDDCHFQIDCAVPSWKKMFENKNE